MRRARFLHLIMIGYLVSRLSVPGLVFAAQGEYPSCAPNASCNIGEFLYDDEYSPIATADCKITSRDPEGNLYVNSATMSAQPDGWYSYTATPGATLGIYRTQICCTSGADYLCLDKTFQVKDPATSLSASDVWNYSERNVTNTASIAADVWSSPNRTLTGFGSLVADIWGYSSKSLSNFGDLVSNIWGNASRTITGGAVSSVTTNNVTIATKGDIKTIVQTLEKDRVVLEQLVHKPIIKTFIDESNDLRSKLDKTSNLTFQLHSAVGDLKSRSELLDLQWPALASAEIQSELATINKILTEDQLRENSSIIATTNWLKNAWNTNITLNLADQANAAQSKIQNLITELSLFGKNQSPLAFKSALTHIQNLDTLVGTSLNTADDTTLYGYLKKLNQLSSAYDLEAKTANNLLSKLDTTPKAETDRDISNLSALILENNQVPSANTILEPAIKDKGSSRNRLLGMLALINTNISLLVGQTGKVVNRIWLEEGSIIFRAVVTNPSRIVAQKIPVEIYLPEEIKSEQIIQTSPGLNPEFNQSDNQMLAAIQIELSPLETRTFFVEVEDIWKYSPEEIESLKKQVEELNNSLKNTAFYSQGTSLKTDAIVALDKIILRQKEAVTPESRIKTYRESRLEMIGIAQKIDALKLLMTQANGNSSIFGFVGGVQAVAVWGLIIILVAGFVFLSLYMRTHRLEQLAVTNLSAKPHELLQNTRIPPNTPHRHAPAPHRTTHRLTMLSVLTLLATGLGSVAGSTAIRRSRQNEPLRSPLVNNLNFRTLGASNNLPQASSSAHLTITPATNILNK